MNDKGTLDYGETVRVLHGEHAGRLGAVVSINERERSYTIEFGDGTDCEIAESNLTREG